MFSGGYHTKGKKPEWEAGADMEMWTLYSWGKDESVPGKKEEAWPHSGPLDLFDLLSSFTTYYCLLLPRAYYFWWHPGKAANTFYEFICSGKLGQGENVAQVKRMQLYSWSHCPMDQHLYWFHLDLSHFPMSYTYFSEGPQEIFASWKSHLREVLPSSSSTIIFCFPNWFCCQSFNRCFHPVSHPVAFPVPKVRHLDV